MIQNFYAGEGAWGTPEIWLEGTGTGAYQWSYGDASIWQTGNWYLITSQSKDNAGNRETPGVSISFLFDSSSPVFFSWSTTK